LEAGGDADVAVFEAVAVMDVVVDGPAAAAVLAARVDPDVGAAGELVGQLRLGEDQAELPAIVRLVEKADHGQRLDAVALQIPGAGDEVQAGVEPEGEEGHGRAAEG